MWPIRSRRTFERVTSTPQRSQMMPLKRPEDLLAEQAVLLGLERAVVDGLRLLHLAVGPHAHLVLRGQADPQLVKVVHVEHSAALLKN
jgi:hypothetical protein